MSGNIPTPPPVPPLPTPYSLPPEILEDDEFTEKRYQKELQFLMVGAIERADTGRLHDLVEKGVNTNATIILVKTPLTQALDQSDVSYDIIDTLLKAADTDPNLAEKTPRGLRPLHLVAKLGHVKLAKLFLDGCKKSVCDVNAVDKGGATPLHFAARFGRGDMVKYLLERSADMLKADDCGRTVLHRACEFNNIDIAKMFLDKGMDINGTDNYGWTALYHSVLFSYIEMTEFLLNNGARVDIRDFHGYSPLQLAWYNTTSPLNEDHLPEKVVLSTSFNIVDRIRSIPSEEFQNLITSGILVRIFQKDDRCFDCVKMLINVGADPKEYRHDEMNCNMFSTLAQIRGYVIVAGALLDPRDVCVDGTTSKTYDNTCFSNRLFDRINLSRQCRYTLRKCLTHTRNIRAAIDELPLPNSLKEKMKLDTDFELFMNNLKEGVRH